MMAQDVSVLGGCISVDLHGHLISFSHLGLYSHSLSHQSASLLSKYHSTCVANNETHLLFCLGAIA